MIRHRDLGAPATKFGPCHVFWFGGLCITTARWSDEPRSVEYVGDDEAKAVETAQRIAHECDNRVEVCLRKIVSRIG